MKIEGTKKLLRQMDALPDSVRDHMAKVVARGTEEGARVARTLAPDTTGETRAGITTEYHDGGLTGEVVVIASDASREEKDRAYSIEHGRKEGNRGTTEGYHFVHRTRQFLGKKNRNRIKRGLKKAIGDVTRG